MLDSSTKRRIDTARDILVGKVPDPKSQVEQITIALIYKFMDDIDAESEELGGTRTFFAGAFARYGWAKLVRAGLGGHETLNLYAEAITTMPENPGIPPLFRDIFKNAFLPYRDPETLRAFLKVIDEFTYDHSERLGDAFEYLLSVLGAQGDAGQFRTPRHVIDFIVTVLDPQKDESVLDPACGTAGFLVSSYKHIRAANTDADGHSTLTPDDRGRLAANFRGYDISPDMVRLSLVNLYLHGFAAPHVFEYDTLTSEDRWHERADVILANPPFMSPKGGIRPHGRFSVKSKRSEVLFVDYMAEHLTPAGRAGIIVPEGIIFQSQKAHKQLRKLLVEDFLVAVVSLPAGVFQPYSGVKTSILLLDKALAKRTDHIGFFKVEHDGYDLGAQRRPIERNDLPRVEAEVGEYLRRVRTEEAVADFAPTLGQVVAKERVAADGDYNLSGERYWERKPTISHFEMMPLGEVCEIRKGSSITRKEVVEGSIPVIAGGQKPSAFHNQANRTGETITVSASGAYAGFVSYFKEPIFASDCSTIKPEDGRLMGAFLFHVLKSKQAEIYKLQIGMGQPHVYPKDLSSFRIPLPPLETQREVMAEIENYQRMIDGAQAVIHNYQPHIPVDSDWPMVEVGNVTADLKAGFASGKSSVDRQGIPHVRPMNVTENGRFSWKGMKRIGTEEYQGKEQYELLPGDVLFNNTNSKELVGKTCMIDEYIRGGFSNHMTRIRVEKERCDAGFLAASLHAAWHRGEFVDRANKWVGQAGINMKSLRSFRIPLPPLATQQAIVAEIEAERALVDSNLELVRRFEKKVQAAIARVWGDEKMSE